MTSDLLFFGLFFLIGSLPTAFLVGKITQGKDLRTLGSGNIGATNAFRVLGKKAGFFVFAVDLAKGFLPVFLAKSLYTGHENFTWLAAAPILGHIFTPFLGFKGGKGVATGAGVLLALRVDLFIFSLGVWALIFLSFRVASIASLIALSLLPIWAWVRGCSASEVLFLVTLAVLITWTHRSNLERLLKRKEGTLRFKSK